MIRLATSDEEIQACFPVMVQLRPQLLASRFVATIRHMQKEGYHLAQLQAEERVVAVAGFRLATNLHLGRYLYVDDLVTDGQSRSQGYGEEMLAWLEAYARVQSCAHLHLDSGTQRAQAHKFYFSQGMTISSYHFLKPLIPE